MRRSRPPLLLPLALALAVLAAACSGEASTRADASEEGPTTTAAPVRAPETIPDGVTLRVGDQLDYLKTVLELAGEDQGYGYDVEYASFVGGPPMLQAFQGDAIDIGFVGSTPLIFAQAAGQDIRAVAGWASAEASFYGLVTAPGVDDVAGWDDVRGKRIAYQRGTAGEAVLLQSLDEAGIELGEITPVDVSQLQVAATLQGGGADLGISIEPLTSAYLTANEGAEQVARADRITDRSSFLIATEGTLADEGRSAALADYLSRLVRAFGYLRENEQAVVDGVFTEVYGLSPERAAELQVENGETSFYPIPDDELVEAQQHLADLFVEAGQIPEEVDVTAQFDNRFNDLVAEEQGS
ncbi:MAG TPA: ABC transporter substrate-binding protein [Iamia sp.]|nr:ABC transporter substrate-binding protein [Iamia sp.]